MLKIRMMTFANWIINDPNEDIQQATPKFMKKNLNPQLNVPNLQTQTIKKEFIINAINAMEMTKISETVVNAEIWNSARV